MKKTLFAQSFMYFFHSEMLIILCPLFFQSKSFNGSSLRVQKKSAVLFSDSRCFASNKSILKQVILNSSYTSTLTPMHLRKAKLMFFYTRYPSSAVIKVYFPDVKFNKNNTAQLVKWFSNFRWVNHFVHEFFLWLSPKHPRKDNHRVNARFYLQPRCLRATSFSLSHMSFTLNAAKQQMCFMTKPNRSTTASSNCLINYHL